LPVPALSALSHGVVLTYVLLGCAVLSLWLPPARLKGREFAWWPWTLEAAVLAGMLAGLVSLAAAAVLAVLALAAGWAVRLPTGWLRTVLHGLVAAGALALALHLVPGFVNPPIVTELRLTATSAPFTQRLNFDTAAAGLILCGALCWRIRDRAGWAGLLAQWPWILGPAVLVNGLALLSGYALFEPKWPAYAPYYLVINLLFTCVAEEAFFRGLIQEKLDDALARLRYGTPIAIGVASVLFGIAHARGGALLVALATVAGAGYGLAYQRSGRIEGGIAAHIALNGMHFLLLSYPRAI
jgi:membrane protease YdiL (CAAX protease family)